MHFFFHFIACRRPKPRRGVANDCLLFPVLNFPLLAPEKGTRRFWKQKHMKKLHLFRKKATLTNYQNFFLALKNIHFFISTFWLPSVISLFLGHLHLFWVLAAMLGAHRSVRLHNAPSRKRLASSTRNRQKIQSLKLQKTYHITHTKKQFSILSCLYGCCCCCCKSSPRPQRKFTGMQSNTFKLTGLEVIMS